MNDTLTMPEKQIKDVNISDVTMENQRFLKISNSDQMRPFFMTIVSNSDHWMFISSNGGLSAGRKNSDSALFPYYTDDKITESYDTTGSKTIFQVNRNGETKIWEPFSERGNGLYNNTTRNLYKNLYGNKIIFEEINHDLELKFQYQWNSSDKYGFVRKSNLTNLASQSQEVRLVDGIQNILPYGIHTDLQAIRSNLADAYKRNELIPTSGIGVFALSAIIVDKAEPSEALKATSVWSYGLENPTYLLSSLQLDTFRNQGTLQPETDVKGEKAAYFVTKELTLEPNQEKEWVIVAEVNQTQSDLVKLDQEIQQNANIVSDLQDDINQGTKHLIQLNAQADALQCTSDDKNDARHFSNTLFNIMRGGIFDNHYQIEKQDFTSYLYKANNQVLNAQKSVLDALPETFSINQLNQLVEQTTDLDFKRLCIEYLPLKFSRRHGDPSRPWNRFSINTQNEDGSKVLDYEGNWRDIFQNWEALAVSYPEFLKGMIFKFLNTSTFDGYNPYRITKDGFDWEIIEPDDPWSYIGYWGDHQIIYLLKLLELYEKHYPNALNELLNQDVFVYANVPYKIKSYEDILKNPKDTIEFDEHSDETIRLNREKLGADAALLQLSSGERVRANLTEKLLATVLAKLSNFVPEAGIWMNTQRPEWNDANNALVGNGVSMVTLYYLIRCLKFLNVTLDQNTIAEIQVSEELATLFEETAKVFHSNEGLLTEGFSDTSRKTILDGLGIAASNYRNQIYNNGFNGKKSTISVSSVKELFASALSYLEQSAKVNRREDGMYHAYNLITIKNENEVSIDYLSEMLEGQVAVLSSGMLSSKDALSLLDSLKVSKLFRPDQYSYILYPNKELDGFMKKNNIPQEAVNSSSFLQQLLDGNNHQIIEKDVAGNYHFNANFRNANDLNNALENLSDEFKSGVSSEKQQILDLYETVFNHKAFTGRSGTFFGYEGLGSIYWHMVSKLLLAVQETCLQAIENKEDDVLVGKLLEHYYEINAGIGVHKPPQLYGAFPTDAYSHTPAGKGAQQPGMTGQVKEDFLSRFGELGVFVKEGQVEFNPCLLRVGEFLSEPSSFKYVNVSGQENEITVEEKALAFTYGQIPIVYKISDADQLNISLIDGTSQMIEGTKLSKELSKELFERTGKIEKIIVEINQNKLK